RRVRAADRAGHQGLGHQLRVAHPAQRDDLADRRPVAHRVPDRQIRVRRRQHQPARGQGQRAAGLPQLDHHHRQPGVLPQPQGLPAAAQRPRDPGTAADRGDRRMTATLPATRSRPAAHRAPRPAGPAGRRRRPPRRGRGAAPRGAALSPPGALRALLAGLVLLSLAWGAFGGWVATRHSSAAGALGTTDERLSLDGRQMFQSVADADATIPAAVLARPQPPRAQLQRYQKDLAAAHDDLSRLQAAGGSQATASALRSLGSGLSAYSAYVGEATAEYAMGFPLTGGSFVQVASEEAHLVLLPARNTVVTQESDALNAGSGQATELPTVLAAIALALVTAFALYRAQRWLTRSTNP